MTPSFENEPEDYSEPTPQQRQTAPDWQNRLDSLGLYSQNDETTIKAVRVDFGKRLVALIIDMFAAYILAQGIGLIPLFNVIVPANLVLILALLVRDYFFEGRGLGKNLMGLQVVDVMTGQPCSLVQSIKRNIIILGPLLVLYIITLVLKLITAVAYESVANYATMISSAFNIALEIARAGGSIYTLLVIPYEAYRVYSRADGRRFGDLLAGTAVIEAPMDFSKPLPRQ